MQGHLGNLKRTNYLDEPITDGMIWLGRKLKIKNDKKRGLTFIVNRLCQNNKNKYPMLKQF